MSRLADHIDSIWQAVSHWLQPDNSILKDAIDRTVAEGYFSFPDVKHAVLALKQALNRSTIEQWVSRSVEEEPDEAADILCLHAGNIPLVGFQDTLAVLLTGNRYYGKISRKDPYLIPSFLESVRQVADPSLVDSALTLDAITLPNRADAVIFAGSQETVPVVRQELDRLGLISERTRYLIRTASFSVAYLDRKDPDTMQQFVEAVFRYGGQGCRSVGTVITPFRLDDIKCELTDYIESFWLRNPQHQEPSKRLSYLHAYDKAIERSHAWLDTFLIESGDAHIREPFLLSWVEGNERSLKEFARVWADELQNIYLTTENEELESISNRVDLLKNAQSPAIDWKPDGVDTIAWLTSQEAG